jgi:uncharacterized protein (TIGR02996 family)
VSLTEGDFLLREVIERPGDDGLRMIYADWLEGDGQPLRAEFIRVQVLGAAACDLVRRESVDKRRRSYREADAAYRAAHGRAVTFSLKMFPLAPSPPRWFWADIPEEPAMTDWGGSLHGDVEAWLPEGGKLCWRRGFIERMEITLNGLLDHAETLFLSHPIADVRLTDVRPVQLFAGHADDPDRDLDESEAWRFLATYQPGGARPRLEVLPSLLRDHPSEDAALAELAADVFALTRELRRSAWEGVQT